MLWDRDKLLMELSHFELGIQAHDGEFDKYKNFYDFSFVDHLDAKHSVGWLDTGEFRVVMQTFECKKPKGTVFVFHGYFDHAGIYHHLIEFLLSVGFNVVIYDMPGHGLSSGKRTWITDFKQYQEPLQEALALLKDRLQQPFHAVGQSTGGAVLIDYLSANENSEFDKVVLLAPLVRPMGWVGVKSLHSLVKPFFRLWRRSFSTNSTDMKFVEFLKKIDPLQSKYLSVDWIGALKEWVVDIESRKARNLKLLVVQGTADKTVDWQHNISVVKHLFQQVKTAKVEGGHHHLVNEAPDTRNKVFQLVSSELLGTD